MMEKDCGESCTHCSQKKHNNAIQVYNPSGFPVKKGDKVEIYAHPGKTILAGFLVFIVPLILFVVFYFTGSLVFPSADDGVLFFCGIAGVAAGFLLNLFISMARRQKDLPEITKILTD
jgi:positive regulator of sigma E activity